MTIHHDKPIGVDIFFREIFAGDTVRDQDGKEYTIDERGWARPFDGSAGCGFKRLKEPVFVKAADKPEAPAKFQEKDGKVGPVVPVDIPKPEPLVRLAPQTDPAPAVEYREGPAPHRGGRVNKSGFSQLGNLAGRVGLTVTEARKICEDAGIEVVSYGKNHKAHVRVEDMPKVRELLTKASGLEPAPSPGNNGNHRPNTTGYASFANLARGLHAKAWELRDFAKAHDFSVVRPTDKAHRNDGIYKEDEVRFRELWAVEHGSPAPAPAPAPVSAPEDDLHRPILGTTDIKKVWTKFDAFLILEDKDLADELRRRGYEVIAIKHVEL